MMRTEKYIRMMVYGILGLCLMAVLLCCGGCGKVTSDSTEPTAPPSADSAADTEANTTVPGGDKAGENDHPAPTPPDDPENPPAKPDKSHAKEADLMIFMGQSNMAGRGSYADSTPVTAGNAYEFKAISDPTKFYPMKADFGVAENTFSGVWDGNKKTGSLVPAFCESYATLTKTPIIGVSCSEGGTDSLQWQSGRGKLEDAVARLEKAKVFLDSSEEFSVRHIYMVWCQGESDARHHISAEDYQKNTQAIFAEMQAHGVEKCFLIAIGNYNGTEDPKDSFEYIREAQKLLCKEDENFLLVSDRFASLRDRMKDDFHFYQDAYNAVGEEAGRAAATYVLSLTTAEGHLPILIYDEKHKDTISWDESTEN